MSDNSFYNKWVIYPSLFFGGYSLLYYVFGVGQVFQIYYYIFGLTHTVISDVASERNLKRLEDDTTLLRVHILNPVALLIGVLFLAAGPGRKQVFDFVVGRPLHRTLGYAVFVLGLIGSVAGFLLTREGEPYEAEGSGWALRAMGVTFSIIIVAAVLRARSGDLASHGRLMRLWMVSMMSGSLLYRLGAVLFLWVFQYDQVLYGYMNTLWFVITTYWPSVLYAVNPNSVLFTGARKELLVTN
eukprot:PhM_4_TR4899/c0_g1_i1/m.20401